MTAPAPPPETATPTGQTRDAAGSEARLSLVPLLERPELTVLRGIPATPRAGPPILCFRSWAPRGTAPEYRRALAQIGRPILFAMEHDFGYYVRRDRIDVLRPVIDAELARLGAHEVDTLGFSTGAYGAIAWAALLPVRRVLSMAPRWSPDPAIVPDPRRRPLMARQARLLRFPSLSAGLTRAGSGLILHGLRGPDRLHLPMFRVRTGLDHRVLPEVDHFVPEWLKAGGLLDPLIVATLDQDRKRRDEVLATIPTWSARGLRSRWHLARMARAAPRPDATPGRMA